MNVTHVIKKILISSKTKILSIGTPPEEEVLFEHVIKRKIPEESSEKLLLQDMKKSLKNMFHQEGVEFSRGTPTPSPKIAAKKPTSKKKAPAKKPAEKKTAKTKKTTVKPPVSKSSVTKKEAAKKQPAPKKESTKKQPVPKKETIKKETVNKETTTAQKATVTKKAPTTKKSTPAKKKAPAKTSVTEKESKTTAAKKTPSKKTAADKTTTSKKAPTTTASAKTAKTKSAAAPRGAKKAAKIALYTKDITKHYGEVDEDFLAIIVKNLGPSIYKRDAELVSCSDPKELDTVRKNFLTKKLGIDASQGVLDAAIQDVCEELKATRTKYRATFYYALAKKFKKESALS